MEPNPFGESKTYYRLYNTVKGAVFYFENHERDKVLSCIFEMELENLYIVGEPEKAVKFSFKLNPG